jgi:hypothetical protein
MTTKDLGGESCREEALQSIRDSLCNLLVIATLKWTNLVGQEAMDEYSA